MLDAAVAAVPNRVFLCLPTIATPKNDIAAEAADSVTMPNLEPPIISIFVVDSLLPRPSWCRTDGPVRRGFFEINPGQDHVFDSSVGNMVSGRQNAQANEQL